MSPEDSVKHVARIVTANSQFTEESVYSALAAANVPDREADLAYKFTQAAWGRLVLDGMGVTFADGYHCLDGNGNVLDSGKLADEPHFIAASRLGKRYTTNAGFKRMAAMSSDFHALNQALHAGSKPENLVTAPLVLFVEPPTEAGMAKARRLISDSLSPRDTNTSRPARSRPPIQPRFEGTVPPTAAAPKRSWLQRLFGGGAGR